jgi:predicted metal-dependent hydrolase
MASKKFPLTGFGEITIAKRSTNRNIRLSVKADGAVLVTIPSWATYQSGLRFAHTKIDWLLEQVPEQTILRDGQAVGKYHHLQLSPT